MNTKFFDVIFQNQLYTELPDQVDVVLKRFTKQDKLLPVSKSEEKRVKSILEKGLRGKISGRYRRKTIIFAQTSGNIYYALTPALFWFPPSRGRGNLTEGWAFTEIELTDDRFFVILVGTGEIQQYMIPPDE